MVALPRGNAACIIGFFLFLCILSFNSLYVGNSFLGNSIHEVDPNLLHVDDNGRPISAHWNENQTNGVSNQTINILKQVQLNITSKNQNVTVSTKNELNRTSEKVKAPYDDEQRTVAVPEIVLNQTVNTLKQVQMNLTNKSKKMTESSQKKINRTSEKVTTPYYDNQRTVAVPDFGIENGKSCRLDPAWGTINDASERPCIGKKPTLPNTTARHLTCPNYNHKMIQPSPDGITIAMLYFAKPAMLLHQLDNFISYPPELRNNLTILIIDDGSPEGLQAKEYISTNSTNGYDDMIRIRIARVTQNKNWNIGGARNLAFYLADTTHVLLLDVDTLIPVETIKAVNGWKIVDGSQSLAHRFNRIREDGTKGKHPAVSLLGLESYWKAGGCDEDFVGHYGFTDVHFWARWKKDPQRAMIDHVDVFLIEFGLDACNSTKLKEDQHLISKCMSARNDLKIPSKKNAKNKEKFRDKMNTGCWSNRYLRFRWVLER